MVYSQRKAGVMALYKEEMDARMKKAEEARQSGDVYESQMAQIEVRDFMRDKGLPNIGTMMLPLVANVSSIYFLRRTIEIFAFRASFSFHTLWLYAAWLRRSSGACTSKARCGFPI